MAEGGGWPLDERAVEHYYYSVNKYINLLWRVWIGWVGDDLFYDGDY